MKSIQDLSESARALLLARPKFSVATAVEQVIQDSFENREHSFSAIQAAGIEFTTSDLAVEVAQTLTGNGILQPLLDNPAIEEIWINQPNQLFYSVDGEVTVTDCFLPAEQIRTICLNLLRHSGRRIDRLNPFVDAMLADGSRLHIVIPDVTGEFWAINIRKFSSKPRTLAALVENESLSSSQALELRTAMQAGKNILISGSTNTGKTTMLNALLGELPPKTRVVTCEETFELKPLLEDWVAMQTRQESAEGFGAVGLRKLVKEALRMRPDRLVIGEVREAESFDLLIAMNSGISSLCTIHANSAINALTKLKTLPLLAGPNIGSVFVDQLVSQSLDLVVHLENVSGKRQVADVHWLPR